MRTNRPLRGIPTVLLATSLGLVACGDDDEVVRGEPETTVTESAPVRPDPDTPGGEASTTAPSEGAPRPARGRCVAVAAAADGLYTVHEAGTAVVTRDGGRLSVGAVEPAAGWEARIDDDDADEVEIEFRRGQEQLDLEIEIDDGSLEAQVCNADD